MEQPLSQCLYHGPPSSYQLLTLLKIFVEKVVFFYVNFFYFNYFIFNFYFNYFTFRNMTGYVSGRDLADDSGINEGILLSGQQCRSPKGGKLTHTNSSDPVSQGIFPSIDTILVLLGFGTKLQHAASTQAPSLPVFHAHRCHLWIHRLDLQAENFSAKLSSNYSLRSRLVGGFFPTSQRASRLLNFLTPHAER